MVAMMDEMTLRSRARLAIQELEERVTRCQRQLENGAYTSALVEARSAKPQMVDLCVLLEMLAQRGP